MLRDLLRPRAVLGHLLVLAVAVGCVLLGQWQFDRLAQVRDNNDRLQARTAAAPLELAAITAEGGAIDDAAYEYRRAEGRGTYRPEEEVLQRNREHHGRSGFHVLTPLELADGMVVLVRRGWVPAGHADPPVVEALPPEGEITVVGILERPVGQPSFGARDPVDGTLERVFHTDTTRLDRQVDGELFPMVLRLEEQWPESSGELLQPVAPPVLSEGSHLSYALQWHSFALLALIAYGAWWWKRRPGAATDPAGDGAGRPVGSAVP